MVASCRISSSASEPLTTPLVKDAARPLLADADGVGLLIDLSGRSVRRMNSAGKIPRPIRCGGAVRWRVSDIRSWVDAGCPSRDIWEAMEKP